MFDWFVATNREYRERVARIDVDTMLGAEARRLAVIAEEMKRSADALLTMAIARVDSSGAWVGGKARSSEDWVAATTGASWGEAKGKVELGKTLRSLPETKEALVEGRISTTQAALLAKAGAVDPDSEHRLLELAERASVKELKDATQRVVATASGQVADEQAAVHRTRFLRHWVDERGGFNIQARMTKAAGAKVLAALEPLMETEFADARRQGRRELPDAYRADALVTMAERAMRGPRRRAGVGAAADAVGAAGDGASAATGGVEVETSCDCRAPASASILVRIDHAALMRGYVEAGEISEIDGVGPVPVSDVIGLMSDAFVTSVLVDGQQVRAVSTTTRTVRKTLQIAVEERDRVCVVPGCGVANGLEIDHLIPYHLGGPSSIDNLQRLCKHHHRLKTANKATLTRRETQDGPVFGWLPRTSEAEEPLPGAKRSSDRAGDGEPPGADRTLWTD